MNIKPRNDVVLVKRLEAKYEGKLVLPENAVEKPVQAVVVAVGPGEFTETWFNTEDYGGYRKPIDLKVGDVVFVGKYAGMEIEENGEKLLFVREAEILGKRG